MTAQLIDVTPAEVPRDRWKRPLIIPRDGGDLVAYRRATSFVDVLDDKYNLQLWMQRMVAVGLVTRPDLSLAASAAASDPDANKRQLDDICERSREAAAASSKATIGTALHQLIELMDRGKAVGVVPDQYRKHLASYERATGALTPVHIERFMVLDDVKAAGTPDRIVTVEGLPGCYIADVKTGPSTLKYGAPKVAMQLALYAHSMLYDPETGSRAAVTDINLEKAIVVALDAETGDCTLHWIDIQAGWRGVEMCAQVWGWRRSAKNLLSPLKLPVPPVPRRKPTPPRAPNPTPRQLTRKLATIEKAIESAATATELTAIWREASAAGAWADELTAAAAARKQALTEGNNQPTGGRQ